MNVAFGDHQVTNYQADVEARTIGAAVHRPVVYDGRWPGLDVRLGRPLDPPLPVHRLGDLYWDSGPIRDDPANPGTQIGTEPPPLENLPEPHRRGPARAARADRRRSSRWSPTSCSPTTSATITDTCAGAPCYSNGFTGPSP